MEWKKILVILRPFLLFPFPTRPEKFLLRFFPFPAWSKKLFFSFSFASGWAENEIVSVSDQVKTNTLLQTFSDSDIHKMQKIAIAC